MTSTSEEVQKFMSNQPTYVNYGRVLLDVIMTGVLTWVVIAAVNDNKESDLKKLSIHEVPIYVKKGMNTGGLWHEAMKDKKFSNDEERVKHFKNTMNSTCVNITSHPLCACIQKSDDSVIASKNCMLQNPQPSVANDWFIGSISSAMMIWFLASLATSVGTLPFIQTWISFDPAQDEKPMKILEYRREIVFSYIFLTMCVIVVPLSLTAGMFNGKDAHKHIECVLMMLTYGLCAIVTIGIYNIGTLRRYLTFSKRPANGESASKEGAVGEINTSADILDSFNNMSVNNLILYVHLLVSAPAIAMIIHLTQKWTEINSITNTTLVLSTIFAVAGFSAELANYWNHHTTYEAYNTPTYAEGPVGPDASPGSTPEDLRKQQVNDTHTRLGIIRMFAWVINLIMIVLLFSLAYPIEVEQQKTNSAIFVVVVVLYGAVFLAPDLAREFTQRMSFNSIQFRLYGDFVVRAMALFFVWRASVTQRI